MANNDDSTKKSNIIRIGEPAAIFATTGRPEIIEKKKVRSENRNDYRALTISVKKKKIFLFNLRFKNRTKQS